MNIRQFIKNLRDGTYDVQWDRNGNPDIIMMELRTGYMVSVPGELTISDIFPEPFALGKLWEWMEQPEVKMGLETFYLGVWTDLFGTTFFDVSVQYTGTRDKAIALGQSYNQLVIWDNEKRKAIQL